MGETKSKDAAASERAVQMWAKRRAKAHGEGKHDSKADANCQACVAGPEKVVELSTPSDLPTGVPTFSTTEEDLSPAAPSVSVSEPAVPAVAANITTTGTYGEKGMEIAQGTPGAKGTVTVHFVSDGFTTLGRVWVSGEELTLVIGSKDWMSTCGQNEERTGPDPDSSWMLLTKAEQRAKYGKVIFEHGLMERPAEYDEAAEYERIKATNNLSKIDEFERQMAKRAKVAKAQSKRTF